MSVMQPHEYEVMFKAEDRYWWYRVLRVWAAGALKRHVARGARVLDAGCGTGANLAMLRRRGYDARGVDVSQAALDLAAQRPECRGCLSQASAAELPFPAESFDAVISADVLYLLSEPEEQAALTECRRVLKPGGVLIVNLPAYEWLRGRHDQAIGTQRRYTVAGLRRKLTGTGLEPVRIECRHMLFLPLLAAVRLMRRGKADGANARSDLTLPIGPLNGMLHAIGCVEEWVGRAVRRPFGTSVSAVARRPS